MCEICELERSGTMVDMVEALIEKLTDWAEHTDEYAEQTILNEIIDDLKGIIRGR